MAGGVGESQGPIAPQLWVATVSQQGRGAIQQMLCGESAMSKRCVETAAHAARTTFSGLAMRNLCAKM